MFNSSSKKIILKTVLAILTLLVFNGLIFFQNHDDAENILTVSFLDVGQGDAIFIETPNQTQVLIDAGLNNKIINELSEVMPFFDRTIDIVIPSHTDADHVGGFPEVFRRYQIKNYIDSGFEGTNELNREIALLVQNEKGLTRQTVSRGQKIILDSENNIALEILWPTTDYETKDNNDRSIVARLDYGETSFLFTGDAGLAVEKILIEDETDILDVDILKAGHHGSKTSSSLEFLKKVSPELTIISAGKDNKFGHPHIEVIQNLETVGSKIKNTADDGRILIKSDGTNYWIEDQKLFYQARFFQSLVSTILVNSS